MDTERKQKPERSRGDVFVQQYAARLDELIAKCRDAQAMTSHVAWRLNYQTNREMHRNTIRSLAKRLASASDAVEMQGTNETIEKDIKDTAKSLSEERVRHSAYIDLAVRPCVRCVEQLDQLRQSVVREAKAKHEAQPLIERGLVEEVTEALHAFPVAVWDDEGGVVNVN